MTNLDFQTGDLIITTEAFNEEVFDYVPYRNKYNNKIYLVLKITYCTKHNIPYCTLQLLLNEEIKEWTIKTGLAKRYFKRIKTG